MFLISKINFEYKTNRIKNQKKLKILNKNMIRVSKMQKVN